MTNITQPARAGRKRMAADQRRAFLDRLSETSNVAAAARAAGIASAVAYAERRKHDDFRAAWQKALCEGYVRLETALLSEALIPASAKTSDITLKSRAQKYRLGLSLLAAHRAAVRGDVAAAPIQSSGTARDRVLAKLDAMRDRLRDDDD